VFADEPPVGLQQRDGLVVRLVNAPGAIDGEQVLTVAEHAPVGHEVDQLVATRPASARDVDGSAALRPVRRRLRVAGGERQHRQQGPAHDFHGRQHSTPPEGGASTTPFKLWSFAPFMRSWMQPRPPQPKPSKPEQLSSKQPTFRPVLSKRPGASPIGSLLPFAASLKPGRPNAPIITIKPEPESTGAP